MTLYTVRKTKKMKKKTVYKVNFSFKSKEKQRRILNTSVEVLWIFELLAWELHTCETTSNKMRRWNGALMSGNHAEIVGRRLRNMTNEMRGRVQELKSCYAQVKLHKVSRHEPKLLSFAINWFVIQNLSWIILWWISFHFILYFELNCFTFLSIHFERSSEREQPWDEKMDNHFNDFFKKKTFYFPSFLLSDVMIFLCWFMLIAWNWSCWLFFHYKNSFKRNLWRLIWDNASSDISKLFKLS